MPIHCSLFLLAMGIQVRKLEESHPQVRNPISTGVCRKRFERYNSVWRRSKSAGTKWSGKFESFPNASRLPRMRAFPSRVLAASGAAGNPLLHFRVRPCNLAVCRCALYTVEVEDFPAETAECSLSLSKYKRRSPVTMQPSTRLFWSIANVSWVLLRG